jgi:flagellar biosynthesis component FlhA
VLAAAPARHDEHAHGAELSTFPTILLFATLFRLGLNVASTRLILSEGRAGPIIQAFGHFVVGDDLTSGLIVFLILVVIQFVVITKGAGRISEVRRASCSTRCPASRWRSTPT